MSAAITDTDDGLRAILTKLGAKGACDVGILEDGPMPNSKASILEAASIVEFGEPSEAIPNRGFVARVDTGADFRTREWRDAAERVLLEDEEPSEAIADTVGVEAAREMADYLEGNTGFGSLADHVAVEVAKP